MSYYHKILDDGQEVIREELLSEEASKLAKELVGLRMSGTQLRKYFGEVRHLETLVKFRGFFQINPLVKMLKSKVSYGRRGKSERDKRVPERFEKFIHDSIDNISEPKHFEAFVKHFEAVVGYFYGEGGRD